MCCRGPFCLADLTVDEKLVTAVAVHSTKIARSTLHNTHTSAHFALFPEAFYSQVSKLRGKKRCQLEVKNKNSEEIYFNRFICIALLAICDLDFCFSITGMKYI